eukprot:15273182-Ditylum_brightwellii.AAC.1
MSTGLVPNMPQDETTIHQVQLVAGKIIKQSTLGNIVWRPDRFIPHLTRNRYLWPQKVILNRGMEFMKDFIMLVWDYYGVKCKPITTRNPQANSIVERARQTIDSLLHTFEPGSARLDSEDSWGGILSIVIFALWSMIHATHKATPIQLVFGRDAMINIMYLANWQFIQEYQQI